MPGGNKPIYVTQPALTPLEKFTEYLKLKETWRYRDLLVYYYHYLALIFKKSSNELIATCN